MIRPAAEDVPHDALAALLIVSRNAVREHELRHGLRRPAAKLVLYQAVIHGNKLMTALPVESGARPAADICDGEDALVAVVHEAVRADYLSGCNGLPADTRQRVVDAPQLEAQFLAVAHMPCVTAAAFAKVRALHITSFGRGRDKPLRPRVYRARRHLHDAYIPFLARKSFWNEHGAPAYAAYAERFGGVAVNTDGVYFVFSDFILYIFHIKNNSTYFIRWQIFCAKREAALHIFTRYYQIILLVR